MTRPAARACALLALLLAAAPVFAQPAPTDPPAGLRPGDREAMRMMMRTDEQLKAMIEAEGFTAVTITDTGPRGVELTARDADGRLVEFEVARFGMIVEAEVKEGGPAVNADLMRLLPLPVREAARNAGIADLREIDRSRRGFELEGLDAQGRPVVLRYEMPAPTERAIRAEHGRRWGDDGPERRRADPAAVKRAVEAAGYKVRGDIEFRRAHAAVIAANPEGEVVELHIEPGGEIVREQRRLDLD
jgi:hypothetical protein